MLAIRYMRSICDVMLMSLFDKFLFKILFTNTTKLQFIFFFENSCTLLQLHKTYNKSFIENPVLVSISHKVTVVR